MPAMSATPGMPAMPGRWPGRVGSQTTADTLDQRFNAWTPIEEPLYAPRTRSVKPFRSVLPVTPAMPATPATPAMPGRWPGRVGSQTTADTRDRRFNAWTPIEEPLYAPRTRSVKPFRKFRSN